jgi:hypothetical protein
LIERFIEAEIEWLGSDSRAFSRYSASCQVSKIDLIPPTKAGISARNSASVSSLEEVQELLGDQVFEGVLSAEFSFDSASRFALLDPDFAKLHDPSSTKCSFRLDLNERLSLQLKQASICATTLTGSVSCRLHWTRRVGSLETQKGERVTHGMRRIAQEMCDEQRSWLNDAHDANDALFRTTAGDSHEVSLEDSRLAERA